MTEPDLLKKTQREKNFLINSVVSDEYELIIKFIKKNIEICSNAKNCSENNFREIICESKSVPDQYVEDKKKLYKEVNREEWLGEIKKDYDDEKISICKLVILVEYDKERQKEN